MPIVIARWLWIASSIRMGTLIRFTGWIAAGYACQLSLQSLRQTGEEPCVAGEGRGRKIKKFNEFFARVNPRVLSTVECSWHAACQQRSKRGGNGLRAQKSNAEAINVSDRFPEALTSLYLLTSAGNKMHSSVRECSLVMCKGFKKPAPAH